MYAAAHGSGRALDSGAVAGIVCTMMAERGVADAWTDVCVPALRRLADGSAGINHVPLACGPSPGGFRTRHSPRRARWGALPAELTHLTSMDMAVSACTRVPATLDMEA